MPYENKIETTLKIQRNNYHSHFLGFEVKSFDTSFLLNASNRCYTLGRWWFEQFKKKYDKQLLSRHILKKDYCQIKANNVNIIFNIAVGGGYSDKNASDQTIFNI